MNQIVVSTQLDWEKAKRHLMAEQNARQDANTVESNNMLIYVIFPLRCRLIAGERTQDLYDEIMELGE